MIYAAAAIIIISVAVDQILKLLVINTLDIGQTVPLIDSVFHFTYIQNFGAAFSILQNKQSFLIIFTAAVMVILALYMIKNIWKNPVIMTVSLALIIGGGIGNVIDRGRLGYVVDFLDFRAINYPVFNFADCCVVIGAILLIVSVVFSDKLRKPAGRASVSSSEQENL